jgi:1-acyl-sn-glycerol-3-phosphate acyltransferase
MDETEKSLKQRKRELKAQKKRDKKELKKQKRREKNAEKWAKQRRLLFPANKKGIHRMHRMNFLRFMLYPLHALVYPFKLHGAKKVGLGAYIYVGNHYSMFDIFYPAHTTCEGVHYFAKQSVLEIPIVGYWARKVGVIGVNRDGTDIRPIMDAMKVLKNGEKVSLFPEGTRNKVSEEEFLPFHGGAAMLAIKTKTPVIPFVVCNRPRVFRRTHVVFGEPMELSEYYGKKLTQEDYDEADDKIKNRLYELRAEYRATKKKFKKKGNP